MARTALSCVDAVLAKNLPHRSRENEFTDGRVKNALAVRRKTLRNFVRTPPSLDVQDQIVFSHIWIPTVLFLGENNFGLQAIRPIVAGFSP